MALLDKSRKIAAEVVYDEIKQYLEPKDGYTHILMINSFSKWLNKHFSCDEKYTVQVNKIVTEMQKDGYEIIDIKLTSLMNQGIFGEMEGYHTLIIYK